MKVTAIDHVQLAMPAGQEDAARRFYAGLLGWTFDEPFPDYPHAREAGLAIGIREDPDGPSVGLAWRVPDLGEAVARARDLGAEVSDPSSAATGRGATCTDADGNEFFLWEPGPGY